MECTAHRSIRPALSFGLRAPERTHKQELASRSHTSPAKRRWSPSGRCGKGTTTHDSMLPPISNQPGCVRRRPFLAPNQTRICPVRRPSFSSPPPPPSATTPPFFLLYVLSRMRGHGYEVCSLPSRVDWRSAPLFFPSAHNERRLTAACSLRLTPSPALFLPLTGLLGGVRRAAQAQHCFEMGPPGRRGCHPARSDHPLAHRSRPIQRELELTAPLVDVVGRSAPTTGSHSPSAEPHQQASPCCSETGNNWTVGPEDKLGHDVPLARLVHLQCLHDFRTSSLALFSMSYPR